MAEGIIVEMTDTKQGNIMSMGSPRTAVSNVSLHMGSPKTAVSNISLQMADVQLSDAHVGELGQIAESMGPNESAMRI